MSLTSHRIFRLLSLRRKHKPSVRNSQLIKNGQTGSWRVQYALIFALVFGRYLHSKTPSRIINTITHTYTHIYAYIHTHMHTYNHTYIHTYIHTCIHTYIHTYIYTHAHTHIYTYIHSTLAFIAKEHCPCDTKVIPVSFNMGWWVYISLTWSFCHEDVGGDSDPFMINSWHFKGIHSARLQTRYDVLANNVSTIRCLLLPVCHRFLVFNDVAHDTIVFMRLRSAPLELDLCLLYDNNCEATRC